MSDPSIIAPKLLCAGLEDALRTLVEKALAAYSLTFVPNAFEALRLVNARPFDGYILECWLPDLTGTALCRDIRKSDPHAPILFCSGPTREVERTRALKAGASACVCKPIDTRHLRSQMHSFLGFSLAQSLSAKLEAERAVQDELNRQLTHAGTREGTAAQLKAASVERMARARAYKAFVEARGTRAHFESWWPRVFFEAHMRFRKNHPGANA